MSQPSNTLLTNGAFQKRLPVVSLGIQNRLPLF